MLTATLSLLVYWEDLITVLHLRHGYGRFVTDRCHGDRWLCER